MRDGSFSDVIETIYKDTRLTNKAELWCAVVSTSDP